MTTLCQQSLINVGHDQGLKFLNETMKLIAIFFLQLTTRHSQLIIKYHTSSSRQATYLSFY